LANSRRAHSGQYVASSGGSSPGEVGLPADCVSVVSSSALPQRRYGALANTVPRSGETIIAATKSVRIVADKELEIDALREVAKGNW
jgi:hypothetical protein